MAVVMKSAKLWTVLIALLFLVGVAGLNALVPAEADRPPPANIAVPTLTPIPVPFTHRWHKDTSHPLLAAAAVDIDGDGSDEVFLGGSDGQPDALLAWRGGALADIAGEAGIGDQEATYGALSLDLDNDGKVDLITAGNAGVTFWMNKGGRFERRPLAAAIPEGGVPMAITAGDFDRDGHVDLYLSVFVSPKLFRSPVFNDPAHAKKNVLLHNRGGEGLTSDRTSQSTFGLPSDAPAPSAIVVEWLDGNVTRIESPPLDQAIVVDAP
jgi:hypothetical protein